MGNGPMHNVRISSNPSDAVYTILNKQGELVATGTTPDNVVLRSSGAMFEKARYLITFESPGLPNQSTRLTAHFTPFYFANLIMSYPGLLGLLVIDPFTGSMYKLRDEVTMDLTGIAGSNRVLSGNSVSTPEALAQ